MANNFINRRNNRTKLRSWFSCILLNCVIGLPCTLSECLGVNITVATYPAGTIAVLYGEPLEIFCVAEGYTSDDIEFTSVGNHVESERINDTTRRLYIERPEKQLSAYYCRNKKTGKACVNRVLVESPPTNVTDFHCISRNLDKLNCSWTCPVINTPVHYTLTFVKNGVRIIPACVAQRHRNIAYCIWDLISHPRYRQYEATLDLYLTACNIFGCNNQSFSIDHFSIVKPDPPFNLKVVESGAHSVCLKWSIPYNMVHILPDGVEHIIEYQIANVNSTYFNRVSTRGSGLGSKNETYKFQLSNLPYAHMQYEVRIYIKTKKAVKREYWSDFSFVMFYTASERPRRPPDMIAGAFDQGILPENRIVYVYWKQLEEYEQVGKNFSYKVCITQGNIKKMYSDASISSNFVILREVSLEALDVTVWSDNANGSSINSSHLYVPAYEDTQSLRVKSFTKIRYENGTCLLDWFSKRNIDNYTLFWCLESEDKICLGRIYFTVLAPSKNHHVIDLPREHKYQFAISANSGAKTSGMVWAITRVLSNRFGLSEFPLQLKYDAPGKSSVHLRWRMDYVLQDAIITGYNISYCPIVVPTYLCDMSYEKKYEFISNPKQKDVLIENLLPFKIYVFTLAVDTIYGQKNIENGTIIIATPEDIPFNQ